MNTEQIESLRSFVDERLATLTKLRREYNKSGDHSADDYLNGAIDSYDLIKMQLEEGAK